jgi:hypothetical protein
MGEVVRIVEEVKKIIISFAFILRSNSNFGVNNLSAVVIVHHAIHKNLTPGLIHQAKNCCICECDSTERYAPSFHR